MRCKDCKFAFVDKDEKAKQQRAIRVEGQKTQVEEARAFAATNYDPLHIHDLQKIYVPPVEGHPDYDAYFCHATTLNATLLIIDPQIRRR